MSDTGPTVTPGDRRVLRDLALQVTEAAADPAQAEKVRLWTACNDLEPERAMVFANPQGGWKEIDAAWIELECQDPALRGFELALRRKLVRRDHIPDDYPILPTFEVAIQATGAGYDDYGLKLGVQRTDQSDGAYQIKPAIRTEADLDRLHPRPIRLDPEGADLQADLAHGIFGDLLRVERRGRMSWRYGLTRVLVHMRGIDQMMMDMFDNPGLLHRLQTFLRDDYQRELDLYEQAGEVSLNNIPDHLTGSGGLCPTTDLPGEGHDGRASARHCLCWGESQETVGVGPDPFDEFVLQYQLPLLNRFGLVDYGCCEPLDHKLDLLIAQIPHLRWLSISPWCDREFCAERIAGKYVYVYKPNPSRICSPTPDWEGAEAELRETLEIARSCPVHLVMKDTHTFCGEPGRITRWAEMASRVAAEAA
ncbi:MAG: hypothetical protein QGI83_17665 [Candidatus Latescibacteria bacterium]|nr:hypothetical protein [Candidatus Latescibacterota bacterium]